MALLQCIKAEIAKDNVQYEGDCIKVLEDDHQPSGTELEKFDYLTVKGTRQEVEDSLYQLVPIVVDAYKWKSDSIYHLDRAPKGDKNIEMIRVFRVVGSEEWYKLINEPKCLINIKELSASERQLLEIYDITHSSVGAFIGKIVKDLSADPVNQIEIEELRNTNPSWLSVTDM